MDEFRNSLEENKFRSTRAIWNELKLNDPFSVGYVSSLIEAREFASKEDWEEFYYQSGHERNKKLSALSSDIIFKLNDPSLFKDHPAVLQMPNEQKKLNFQFGRTKDQIDEKGQILFNGILKQGNNLNLTGKECTKCVRYRVICETWNGIIIREKNTIKNLVQLFPQIQFRKVSAEMDHTYAVDYELFVNGELLTGIQIKPKSYSGNAPDIQKARSANQKKREIYFRDFGKDVIYLVADKDGKILNPESVDKIKALFNTDI